MIEVVLTQEARGIGGPLKFENANVWKITENDTLAIYRAFGSAVLAEVPLQHVLFVERVDDMKPSVGADKTG